MNEDGFTTPKGVGSDIPHYVLDYSAEDELQVRLYLKNLLERTSLHIKEINLFQFLLSLFEEDLDDLLELSVEEGYEGLVDTLETILDEQEALVEEFLKSVGDAGIVFITGVGNAYPFLRSSQLLSMLSNKGFRKPIILFYPGYFTGLDLKLFNRFNNEDRYQLSRIS